MKKLLVILVFGLVSLSSVGIARAEGPFVYAFIEQNEVDLGTLFMWDTIIPEALTLKITSNCFHGSVVASISSLRNSKGCQILPDRIFIKTAYTGGFVSMCSPVAISEPAFGSHDIVIDFKVKASEFMEPAGKYTGTIAFTVMPSSAYR
jgi:hypothetical protein